MLRLAVYFDYLFCEKLSVIACVDYFFSRTKVYNVTEKSKI